MPLVLLSMVGGYYYVTFGRLIDAQLHGERQRVFPRIFARPLELRLGQALTQRQLVDRLNDIGYAQRESANRPGEFSLDGGRVSIMPRAETFKGRVVKVAFQKPAPAVQRASRGKPPAPRPADHVESLELGANPSERLTLDTPLLSSIQSEREKRRPVALASLPPHVINAVLAIEDRRFYYHPGIDPIRLTGAVFYSLIGDSRISATSTLTQQLVRNVFLPQFEGWTLQQARERSTRRKILEMWVSLVMSRKATKDEILEMYLNAVPLGQRGSFAVVGVSEAARLFFGKDVSNLSIAEAATIAGVIQSPSALSPFNNPNRCRDRRNVVLRAMADAGFITAEQAERAQKEPLTVVQRALEAEAPYFVDYVSQTISEDYPGLTTTDSQPVEVYTTLDLHLQRLAQDAVRDGLTNVDQLLARRKRRGKAEAALIALDPRTGEILAMVGGRSYNQSQYNRAIVSRRQPGSTFKPFVYLTAFEQAALNGDTDVTPATVVDDSPTTWEFDDQVWTPENYDDEYGGPVTYRDALAHSRNVATIKAAERAGYANVAQLWSRLGVGSQPRAYPSIALGVFEATPLEMATAYTIFPNMGLERKLRHIMKVTSGEADVTRADTREPKPIARPDTTYLVTDMLRTVINEGTGAGARSMGFTLDAAGKTGTTNDTRDAWFIGFTPELLTVVWVGYDDNQIIGLTGAQAALPIWSQFMKGALAGRQSVPFEPPDGISWAEVDHDTGKLAAPFCPRIISSPFLAGTEPADSCEQHRF
ncbi:MAG TPA: PBP1A family penicillin-binding protein [Vicinamibacterales bacterium]|nr:PBP1A family penicillin-binding protein [Vicinamibacterales bacterium]